MSATGEPDGQPSLSQGSQEFFEVECEPCGERGNLMKAEGYCIVCKEFMCPNCIVFHKSMRMSKGHMIQGPDEMPKAKTSNEEDDAALASQDEPTHFCKSHKKEIIKYFCKDHKSVCCVDCVTLSHRSCTNVFLINEVCSDDATSSEQEHFFQRLNGVADGFRNIFEMTERNRIEIEKHREKLLQDVRIYKEYIFETITKLVNGIERKIEEQIKEDQVKTDQLAECCSTIQKHIKVMSAEFESFQNSNRKSDAFILMNQSENMLDEWERNKRDMATSTHLSHDAFCPSLKLRKTLKKIKEIGLLVEETDAEQCEACKTMTLKTSMQSLACGHRTCEICLPGVTENKRTCLVCGGYSEDLLPMRDDRPVRGDGEDGRGGGWKDRAQQRELRREDGPPSWESCRDREGAKEKMNRLNKEREREHGGGREERSAWRRGGDREEGVDWSGERRDEGPRRDVRGGRGDNGGRRDSWGIGGGGGGGVWRDREGNRGGNQGGWRRGGDDQGTPRERGEWEWRRGPPPQERDEWRNDRPPRDRPRDKQSGEDHCWNTVKR